MTTRKKLGQILLEAGVIDEYQLKSALSYQKQWGGKLGYVLVENRFITEEALVEALHAQTGIPVVQVAGRDIPQHLVKLVPMELAEKYVLIPIGLEGESGKPSETLLVAMEDPTNLNALDELRFKTGKRLKPVLAGKNAIEKAIALHYRGEQTEGLEFKTEPDDIQFSGQEVDIGAREEGMAIVQGTLESAPALESGQADAAEQLEELDVIEDLVPLEPVSTDGAAAPVLPSRGEHDVPTVREVPELSWPSRAAGGQPAEGLQFGEDDDFDLDAVLDPLSPVEGEPPGGEPPQIEPAASRADSALASALDGLDVLAPGDGAVPSVSSAAAPGDVTVAALVRLLISKGIISAEELQAELERD